MAYSSVTERDFVGIITKQYLTQTYNITLDLDTKTKIICPPRVIGLISKFKCYLYRQTPGESTTLETL